MSKRKSLEAKVRYRLGQKKAQVFVREDFDDLGGYDQVGRALRKIVSKGDIVKIGYGLYAKTKVSSITGKRVLVETLPRIAKEALTRLKVKVAPSKMEIAYNQGKSTQVPTGRVIAVKGRISRKIGYGGAYVSFEHYSK